uniref:Hydrophobic seed protein domain-containing protein n=1 Tax=Setaria italica TaxID=4555 RepID=K3Y4B6_SETIT
MASKPSATSLLLLGTALLAATVCALAQTPPETETTTENNPDIKRCISAASDFLSGIPLAPGTIQAAVRGLKPVEVAQCVCLVVAGSIGIVDDTPEGVAVVFEAFVRTFNLAVPKGFVCDPVNVLLYTQILLVVQMHAHTT